MIILSSKHHLRHCPIRRFLDFEKFCGLEGKPSGHQVAGKGLDGDVEVANGAVVVAPGQLNLVFDIRQLFLKILEILVGLEIRVFLFDMYL